MEFFFTPVDMIFRLFIFVSTFSNEAQNTLLYLINSFQDDNFWHRFCDFWEVPCSLEHGSPALPQMPPSWSSLRGLTHLRLWGSTRGSHPQGLLVCTWGEKILASFASLFLPYLHAHMGQSAYIKGLLKAFGLRNLFFYVERALWHHPSHWAFN